MGDRGGVYPEVLRSCEVCDLERGAGLFLIQGGEFFPYLWEVLHGLDVTQAGERELLLIPALYCCRVLILLWGMFCALGRLHDDDGRPSYS